ncbi:MAG: anti-sigma factor [Gemmatimonadaceae bacterium]
MSDDEIRNGQPEFTPPLAPTEQVGNSGDRNNGEESALTEVEVQFDVAGAAMGALSKTEEADLYAAAARDQAVSAALADMEAVAADMATLVPVQSMNRGRSAGIRSRLVARAAGTRIGRTPAFTPLPATETPRQASGHHAQPGVARSGTTTSGRAPSPAQSSGPTPAGRPARSTRLIPFEPVSRAGMERIVGALAVAAILVIAAFGLYNWKTRSVTGGAQVAAVTDSILESQISSLTEAVRQKDSLISALTGTHTRVIDLMGYNSVDPMARVFWDQKKQTFIMYASNVKQPPTGKTYQLWLIARGAASPISAGTFMPDSSGSAVMATKHAMEPGTLRRVAVTEEPMGGMPTPTGPIVFTGTGK